MFIEPPPPFCTGPEPRDQPHWTRKLRRRRRRTPAPRWTPQSKAEKASLATTLAGRGRDRRAGHHRHRDRTYRRKQQPPPPRSVYPRLSPSPAPGLSLDRPTSAAFLIGRPKIPRPLDLSDWGRHYGPRPSESLLSLVGHAWQGPGSTSSFQLVTGFSTPPRAPSLFSIGSIPTTGPPFALLVLARDYRKQATLPVSHWWDLPASFSYDDVIFPLASDPWMASG